MKFEILSIGGNTVMCNTGSGCVTYLHVPKQVLHHHGTRLHILLHLFPCFLTPLSNHVQVKNNPVHTLFSEGMFGLNYFRWRLVTVYITLESLPDRPQTVPVGFVCKHGRLVHGQLGNAYHGCYLGTKRFFRKTEELPLAFVRP